MFIGNLSLSLGIFAALLLIVATMKEQRFAPWILCAGVAVTSFWFLSLWFEISFLYRWLNIYLTLVIGVLLTLTGTTGLVLKRVRRGFAERAYYEEQDKVKH